MVSTTASDLLIDVIVFAAICTCLLISNKVNQPQWAKPYRWLGILAAVVFACLCTAELFSILTRVNGDSNWLIVSTTIRNWVWGLFSIPLKLRLQIRKCMYVFFQHEATESPLIFIA